MSRQEVLLDDLRVNHKKKGTLSELRNRFRRLALITARDPRPGEIDVWTIIFGSGSVEAML